MKTLTIKNITFKNRIGMPPMCQYSATDGMVSDWHLHHYAARAIGGVSVAIVESTAVTPEGRITPFDLGLWKDTQTDGMARLSQTIAQYGAVPGIQLNHAGRKASCDKPANGGNFLHKEQGGWQTVAPSDIPFNEEDVVPHALTKEELQDITQAFVDAAKRAVKAGFKIIELHGAHGYLLHQFLSPLSNQRTDEYGGSFENRIRYLLEVVSAVKKEIQDKALLWVRLSATDWADGGWNEKETVELAHKLKPLGVDLLDISTGGLVEHAKIPVKPLYQVPFAKAVKATGIATATVGLITKREEIDHILENGDADLVLLGRELLRNPYFPAINYPEENLCPEQYLRCM